MIDKALTARGKRWWTRKLPKMSFNYLKLNTFVREKIKYAPNVAPGGIG